MFPMGAGSVPSVCSQWEQAVFPMGAGSVPSVCSQWEQAVFPMGAGSVPSVCSQWEQAVFPMGAGSVPNGSRQCSQWNVPSIPCFEMLPSLMNKISTTVDGSHLPAMAYVRENPAPLEDSSVMKYIRAVCPAVSNTRGYDMSTVSQRLTIRLKNKEIYFLGKQS